MHKITFYLLRASIFFFVPGTAKGKQQLKNQWKWATLIRNGVKGISNGPRTGETQNGQKPVFAGKLLIKEAEARWLLLTFVSLKVLLSLSWLLAAFQRNQCQTEPGAALPTMTGPKPERPRFQTDLGFSISSWCPHVQNLLGGGNKIPYWECMTGDVCAVSLGQVHFYVFLFKISTV